MVVLVLRNSSNKRRIDVEALINFSVQNAPPFFSGAVLIRVNTVVTDRHAQS